MKKVLLRFTSLILVFAMAFSITASAIDAEKEHASQLPEGVFLITGGCDEVQLFEDTFALTQDYDKAQTARDTYANLSPEARQIFNQVISSDPEMLAFHQANVDATFRGHTIMPNAVAASSSALTVLSNQLAAIGLPVAVKYALEAMGAGMVAAIADGPLPVGDILFAAAAASAAIVIAANWSAVSSKWTSIVNAFKAAFTTMTAALTSAFAAILSAVPSIQAAPSVSSSGKNGVIGGVAYAGTVKASDLTKQQVGQAKYFVAIRDRITNNVWIDIFKPIDAAFAKAILAANHGFVGVFAVSQSYAKAIAGTDPYGPEIHGNGSPGYYKHYHPRLHSHAHAWFPTIALA